VVDSSLKLMEVTRYGARKKVDLGRQLASLNAAIARTAGDLTVLRALRHSLLGEIKRMTNKGERHGEN